MLPDVIFEETRIINEAVRRATGTAQASLISGAGRGQSVGVPGSSTMPVTDGDSILDGHVFIFGLDEFGDPAAYFGNVI